MSDFHWFCFYQYFFDANGMTVEICDVKVTPGLTKQELLGELDNLKELSAFEGFEIRNSGN